MRYDTKMKLSALAVVGGCAVLFAVVFLASRAGEKQRRVAPNCYETSSSTDVSRTLELVPGPNTNGGRAIYVCGLYSRSALPDVIRCYELKEGCSE